ncbi:MAG TPA: succinylglutamate desuccinylase/aspartoacylase family protein [Woeseiaceae bacterium]|nr:succinylglutamate desuccinylase/aspartoacylase family protein [Woeseiaceae bacterium]
MNAFLNHMLSTLHRTCALLVCLLALQNVLLAEEFPDEEIPERVDAAASDAVTTDGMDVDLAPGEEIDASGQPMDSAPGKPAANVAAHDEEELPVRGENFVETGPAHAPAVPLAEAVIVAEGNAEPLHILGVDVAPGTTERLTWAATELFEGVPVSTPVLVINGTTPGPTLCLTAAVHGDELNGIEMVRRVMHDVTAEHLSGAIIGVPIVNVQGFRRGSRYLPDRRDLNRYFPGNPNGSAAARIANSFFENVVVHCDALVDIHTGSFERANLPQIRADLRDPDVVTLTQGFGATVILHSTPGAGTLRYAATQAGIPTVTLEAGGPLVLELNEVIHGVKGIETLISSLGMVKKIRLWGSPQPVYYRSSWVRAGAGGILLANVSLGSTVREGDILGVITDPMSNANKEIRSPYSGRIIGMARNQVVMPGFAAFHIGIQADYAAVENDGDSLVLGPGEVINEGADLDGISE